MKERELIEAISNKAVHADNPLLVYGIGDDCAVTRKDDDRVLLYTMDTLIESVHFEPAWHPAVMLGRKSVSVNVSDIAAMGGAPQFVLFSLALPPGFDDDWALQLCDGVTEGCTHYGCTLIGGDTVASPAAITMSLTVVGEMAAEQVLYRHGARAGDIIYVSGPLGRAAAGLELLKRGFSDRDVFAGFYRAHLDPRARVELGQKLAATGVVNSMMDLSDGLATDLAHICKESCLGAVIYQKQLPFDPALREAAALLDHGCTAENPVDQEMLRLMIGGGEDYELLFTAPPHATKKLQEVMAISGELLYPVGKMINGRGVMLVPTDLQKYGKEVPVEFLGFDHFSH